MEYNISLQLGCQTISTGCPRQGWPLSPIQKQDDGTQLFDLAFRLLALVVYDHTTGEKTGSHVLGELVLFLWLLLTTLCGIYFQSVPKSLLEFYFCLLG